MRSDHTFSEFKDLNNQFVSAASADRSYTAVSMAADFPVEPARVLGFKHTLSEIELAER